MKHNTWALSFPTPLSPPPPLNRKLEHCDLGLPNALAWNHWKPLVSEPCASEGPCLFSAARSQSSTECQGFQPGDWHSESPLFCVRVIQNITQLTAWMQTHGVQLKILLFNEVSKKPLQENWVMNGIELISNDLLLMPKLKSYKICHSLPTCIEICVVFFLQSFLFDVNQHKVLRSTLQIQ